MRGHYHVVEIRRRRRTGEVWWQELCRDRTAYAADLSLIYWRTRTRSMHVRVREVNEDEQG